MNTPQISWDAPAASAGPASPQIKWDAPPAPTSQVSAPHGAADWLTGLESDLRYGGEQTAPGRFLKRIGYKGAESIGGMEGSAGKTLVSPLTGPVFAAHGIAEAAPKAIGGEGKPARGAGEVLSGIGETAEIPMMFGAPETAEANTNAVKSVAKPVLRAGGRVASRVGNAVDPDLVGVVSPRAANALRVTQKVGKVAGKLGKTAEPEAETAAVYPGAHLPATPRPEQLNPSLVSKARTLPGQISPEVTSRPLGPEEMPPNTVPFGPHSQKFLPPGPPEPIPAEAAPAAPPRISTSPKAVGDRLNESLGGRPLQRNVPLRDQLNVKPSAAAGPKLPDGFIPTESSALRGYKYDPAKQEFEAITKDGGRYRRGEVTPEQFSKFEQADSKGKAWKELSDNSTPLGKHVDGKFTPYKRSDMRSADPNGDLTPLLKKSVAKVKAAKAKSSQ